MIAADPTATTLRDRAWMALGLVVVVALLFGRAMGRFADLDEHQFVAPGVIAASRGLMPYSDFPYFHMPSLVYIYAWALQFSEYKLLVARGMSVIAGTATIAMVFGIGWTSLRAWPRKDRWILLAGLCGVFMSARLFTYASGWAWNHDTANALALGALASYLAGLRKGRLHWFVLAGMLAGLALGVRLSFALLPVAMLGHLLLVRGSLPRGERLWAFVFLLAAVAVANTPAIWLWWHDPQAFLFGNLEYPRLYAAFAKNSHMNNTSLPSRLAYVLRCLVDDPGNLAFTGLLVTLIVAFVRHGSWASARVQVWLLGGVLAACLLGAVAPRPIQAQYVYALLPPLAVVCVVLAAATPPTPVVLRAAGIAVIAATVIAVPQGLARWYKDTIRLGQTRAWVPVQVHRTGEWVASRVPRDGCVMTMEPIVPLEGGCKVDEYFAVGRFPMHVGPLMTPGDRVRYKVLWGEELTLRLDQTRPDAVLALDRLGFTQHTEWARANGYAPEQSPDGQYTLWVRTVTSPAGATTRPR